LPPAEHCACEQQQQQDANEHQFQRDPQNTTSDEEKHRDYEDDYYGCDY